jgi:histone H3/H4
MGESLVVKAKIKEAVNSVDNSFNVGSDVADALTARVQGLLQDGLKRAQGNGRKTLMGKDI